MKLYGAVDAAAELGIEPRVLRRFLRNNPSYRSAGLGGRYVFTESELRSLAHAYSHDSRRRGSTVTTQEYLDDDPGVPLTEYEAARRDPAELKKLRQRRQEPRTKRQQRLEARMDQVLPTRYDDEQVSD